MAGPAWPLIVRNDLAKESGGRENRRTSLLSFVHLSDMHIIDPQSPSRQPFLRQGTGTSTGGLDFNDAYRAQEPFSAQVADSMIQRVNSLAGGPAEGKPFSFVMSTGDEGDWKSVLELQNFLTVMSGGTMVTNTSGQGYVGVMDDYVYSGPQKFNIYDQYWHPNPPPSGMKPDKWKTKWGYPEIPGLLAAASQNFTTSGVHLPWYSAFGNHDGLLGGNLSYQPPVSDFFNGLAIGSPEVVGSNMLLDLPKGTSKLDYLETLASGNTTNIGKMLAAMPKRPIPANQNRVSYDVPTFLQMHMAAGGTPSGHGFTSENVSNKTTYYTFDIGGGFEGITLDTVNASGEADGSIGSIQLAWLEQQLKASTPFYYDENGNKIQTGNPGKYVILFSHHNSHTMENVTSKPFDPDPVKLNGDQFLQVVSKYPNVVLWANGHTHTNRIWSHPDPRHLTNGFWEVNTASHIDWPQQARTVEFTDNNDGTMSIFAIVINDAAPAVVSKSDLSTLGISAISRELSANDYTWRKKNAVGAPSDRNVELVFKKPFDLPSSNAAKQVPVKLKTK